MTERAGSWQLDTTPIPRHILDRLTLHVSLDWNGKSIFTRRLMPSVDLSVKANWFSHTHFLWKEGMQTGSLVLPDHVLSACLPSKQPELRKLVTPSEPTLPEFEIEECYGEPYEVFAWIAERHEPIEDEA